MTYEELEWDLGGPVGLSRSARRRHRGPYRAAVPPRIAEVRWPLPDGLAADIEDATTEIARFDARAGEALAPFSSVLLRSESAASSRIENLTASARAIAEAEVNPFTSGNGARIVANARAMDAALALADHIDADAILAMHHALLDGTDPRHAGRWRTEQVWIGGSDHGPHGAMFVPPHHDRVQAAIADLLDYVDRDDVPLLAHTAIAHAQFETIHPFTDGNGRTGRALVHAQLHHKGLTRNLTVPVSAGLLVDVNRYFAGLEAYRVGNPEPIVEAFCSAAHAAVRHGTVLFEELDAIRSSWREGLQLRRGARAWDLIDVLFRHPVINAKVVALDLEVARSNVYRIIEPYVDAGILVEFSDKKRNRLWRAPDVLEALDAFAARAGRRGIPT